MRTIFITLVTENQSQKEKGEELAKLIQNELGEKWAIIKIETYYKFENSYKIEFKSIFDGISQSELNNLSIYLTDKLVSPWVVYFDDTVKSIELIFNKDKNTREKKPEFKAIRWGHLQIVAS